MVTLRSLLVVLSALALASFVPAGQAHETPAHDGAHDANGMQKRWEARLAEGGGMAVALAEDERGRLWRARAEAGYLYVSHSVDGGKTFVAEVKVNATREAILAEGESRPRLVARQGVVAVAWAQALPKVFAGHIRFSRSSDGGAHFHAPVTLDDDGGDRGHGFVNLSMNAKGRILAVWLDSRERNAQGKSYRGSSVYYALSSDGGEHFTKNRKLADHSCECCRIGLASTSTSETMALWRTVFEDGSRDFALARVAENAAVVRVSDDHWKIEACPHHGGDLAIGPDGRVHLVWFTGADSSPGLHYRYGDGERLSTPMPFGKVEAQAGHGTVFAGAKAIHLAWREFDGERFRLFAMRSADRGASWSVPRERASTSGASDAPLFVTGSKRPLLAWNTAEGLRIIDLDQP